MDEMDELVKTMREIDLVRSHWRFYYGNEHGLIDADVAGAAARALTKVLMDLESRVNAIVHPEDDVYE